MAKASKKEESFSTYAVLTEQDVTDVAMGIFQNAIFTDRHVRPGNENILSMIFFPLQFMDEKAAKELADNPPGMIYGEMRTAMYRSINGYPMFPSVRMLSQDDAKKVWAKYEAIKAAVAGATGATPPPPEPAPEEIPLTTVTAKPKRSHHKKKA